LLENYLGGRSFFNREWSSEKIIEAVETGRLQLIEQGITDGAYEVQVFGETIRIFLENGSVRSAAGNFIYTLSDFGF